MDLVLYYRRHDGYGFPGFRSVHHVVLVAEMVTVVGPEDDDRVVGATGGVERLDKPADHLVGVSGGGLVALDELRERFEVAGVAGIEEILIPRFLEFGWSLVFLDLASSKIVGFFDFRLALRERLF